MSRETDVPCIIFFIDFIVVELTGNIVRGTIDVVVNVSGRGIDIMYFAVQYAPNASKPVINKLKNNNKL